MARTRRTASKRLVQDGALLSEIEETRHLLQLARRAEARNPQGLASEVPRLERQLSELAERAATEAALFVVEAIPADTFDDIKRQHPPTSQDLERWREQAKANPFAPMPEWNYRTMGPDLLEACLVEPGWSRAEIAEWWREASEGERNQIFNLAVNVQTEGSDLPFFDAATASTNGGGEPSNTPANEASP
jgi:predicted transcriptional regulator